MPLTLDPNSVEAREQKRIEHVEYDYDYPDGLDLRPSSDLHNLIITEVMTRARESRRIMSRRHDEWRSIDRVLKAYVPTSIKDKNKDRDSMPNIVMPHTYATLETLLTYMSAAFLQDPIMKYQGVGPEDAYGGEILTHLIQNHAKRFSHGLAYHTQWRDAFAYGIGAVTPVWERKFGYQTTLEDVGFISWVKGQFFKTGEERAKGEWRMLYEGNKLNNIDPYRVLPDPNTSAHEVQDSEFFGWIDRTNVMELLSRERDGDDHIFNARYLRHIEPTSNLDLREGRERDRTKRTEFVSKNNPADVIWMYVDLIPKDWKLGSSEYPEKWFFGVSGDKVVVTAMPLGMHHDMIPAAVCAPDYDGYSLDPPSRLGIIHDVQVLGDFYHSSHIQNIMKVINDMVVADPSLVNIHDLATPKPGKIIRMRRAAWGRGGIDNAIKQLKVDDVTQNHVADAMMLEGVMRQSTGATDQVQGNLQQRTSRISASEFQGVRGSSLSRLEKTARIISMQSMIPLAYMMASHTQQFMEDDTYIKATGEWAQVLRQKYGIQPEQDRVLIRPNDLIVDYDIEPHDGTIPGSENVETWTNILQILGQSPEMAQNFDIVKIFQHLAHQMGAKNLEQFVRQPDQAPQVMPDEDVEREVDRGNLIPATNGR